MVTDDYLVVQKGVYVRLRNSPTPPFQIGSQFFKLDDYDFTPASAVRFETLYKSDGITPARRLRENRVHKILSGDRTAIQQGANEKAFLRISVLSW